MDITVRKMKMLNRKMIKEAQIKRLKMLFKMENSKEKLIIGCFSRTAAPCLE
jgi:hypothetical protein